MKKKREITLKLKKVKIADLSKLSSIMGGNTNDGCNNTGDPGTDADSRKICPPDDGGGVATYSASCPTICPSFIASISIC